jgi:SAM-dependent methyltransferase
MQDASLESLYADKQSFYFDGARPDLLPFVPKSACRILDVGCGSAGFSGTLKKMLQAEVWGVEMNQAASEIARKRLDKVYHGAFGPELDLPENYFDTIFFNDVLEHIFYPIPILQHASTLLSKDGCVIASIPNIRNFPIVWRLVMRGEWEYKDHGILDRTHLRFYTRQTIINLFQQSSYEILTIQGINPFYIAEPEDHKIWRRYRQIAWLIPGAHDMRYLQFLVIAKKKITH